MDLEFTLPEVLAVRLIYQISGEGETIWLEGVQLLSVSLILGILFFYLPTYRKERTRAEPATP